MKYLIILTLLSCTITHYRWGATPIEWTQEEKEFLKQFFQGSLDVDKIKLFDAGWDDNDGACFAVGNSIYFNVNLDYKNNRENLRSVLVHEGIHTWQYQNFGSHAFTKGFETDHHYRLTPQKSFLEYGLEEQASMMEDYYGWIFLDDDRCMRAEDCREIGLDWTIYLVEQKYEEMISIGGK